MLEGVERAEVAEMPGEGELLNAFQHLILGGRLHRSGRRRLDHLPEWAAACERYRQVVRQLEQRVRRPPIC